MSGKIRATHVLFALIIVICSFYDTLYADEEFTKNLRTHQESLKPYLLPREHSLNDYLTHIFKNPNMFTSPKQFKKEGFKVKLGHRQLMVGAHPSIPHYLFKKFTNHKSSTMQLQNYIKRIKGAHIVRESINKHNFKHLVVPQKWLYKLSNRFPSKSGHKSYVLIVENMDIYDDWDNPDGEARKLYYHMDIEMLTELCTVLHEVGGCDAFPRNQPFTRSGKIAFVDTEHVGRMKGHFIKHIVPALSEELQAYALALWMKLEEEEKAKKRS